MSDDVNRPHRQEAIPLRAVMEQRIGAKVVTYEGGPEILPGGMCSCCGSGPDTEPDWRGEPWYVYQAGVCDSDGVYYSMLCEGCLEDIRIEFEQRARKGLLTARDAQAQQITELLGDDLDGAQDMMDDLL